MADIFTPKKRSEIMSRVKSKNTKAEIILRKKLHSEGFRFRIHAKLPGRPDIVFTKEKLAIFCDGEFWHGKNYFKEKIRYAEFWQKKIGENIDRDIRVNKNLKQNGWKVLRFWEDDIVKNLDTCYLKISATLMKLKERNAQ